MAFIDTNNTFSDIAVTLRLKKVNSFLKELYSIINFEKLRPILNTRVIGLVRNNMSFTITCLSANLRLLAQRQMRLRKELER